MNRPTTPAHVPFGAANPPVADGSVHEQLSALVDGEVDAGAAAALWRDDGGVVCATWARYQVIGEALRGAPAQAADAERVSAIMQRVRQERAATTPAPVAVSVAVAPTRAEAANDAVFRWKMLAGFASLAAVVAVAWNMSGAGGAGGASDAAGPQLAQAPVLTAPVAAAPAAPVVAPVMVAGEQGPVLRDPRLEELMAAHRQAGGMSALQMPAGFLRNAAFDLPEGQR
ncbi:sigma-E factor negative regulatory protein [Hydrogenophaga atypica]|uniref:Sigma-E factor negative regulatory protein n=1 Tax=Hydrogenophaga atypica TaxID=249409 RepID=A0ABW2QMI4_9BURK